MAKLNYLTRKTRLEWATEDRRRTVFSDTDISERRENLRAKMWAKWKAEQQGIVIPAEAKAQFVYLNGGSDMAVEFALETRFESKRVWRGRRAHFHPVVEREAIATIPLPEY